MATDIAITLAVAVALGIDLAANVQEAKIIDGDVLWKEGGVSVKRKCERMYEF